MTLRCTCCSEDYDPRQLDTEDDLAIARSAYLCRTCNVNRCDAYPGSCIASQIKNLTNRRVKP